MPRSSPGKSAIAPTRRLLASLQRLFGLFAVSWASLACLPSVEGLAGGGDGGAGRRDGAGGPERAAALGPVAIDPPGRTFVGTQLVKLQGGGAGRTIRYTTDGSVPGKDARVYTEPFTLQASAVVRVLADGPAGGAGASEPTVLSAAFVRVAPEMAYWSSNLPVLVLHTHGSGFFPVVREGPLLSGTITVLEAAKPVIVPPPLDPPPTRLLSPPVFTSRAGLRLRGYSSLDFPQKSYAVELWSPANNLDSEQPLLGLPADSDFALVGTGYLDRSLIRNALAYAISNQIGRYASRTRFVEVFVVEGGDTLTQTDYRGVYTLTEKIKRGPSRVNVTKLEAGDQRDPAITGGYSLSIDHGPAHHFAIGNLSFQYVYPRWEEISLPGWAMQRSYIEGFVGEFLEAVAQPNFRHPRTGKPYGAYIDVPAFIDHNLLTVLFKNVDGLRLSAYFHKDRNGPLVAGPVWDFDRSSGTPYDGNPITAIPRAKEAREWAVRDGTHPLQWGFWGRLFADPTFKAAHTRRWAELVRGPFSPENLNLLIDRLVLELGAAPVRHFTRWPDNPPQGGTHQGEIKLLKDWFAARIPWVTGQL